MSISYLFHNSIPSRIFVATGDDFVATLELPVVMEAWRASSSSCFCLKCRDSVIGIKGFKPVDLMEVSRLEGMLARVVALVGGVLLIIAPVHSFKRKRIISGQLRIKKSKSESKLSPLFQILPQSAVKSQLSRN